MELKLVDAKPLSNKRIDAFYKYVEEQKFNEMIEEEYRAELEYNNSKTIVTRRKFLQYSAFGAVGLGLSLGTEISKAGGDNYSIPMKSVRSYSYKNTESYIVRPKKIIIDQDYLRAGEPAQGRLIVSNETDSTEYNQMILKPISSRSLRRTKKSYYEYEVSPFMELVFDFFNGPWAIPKRKRTLINILASNQYAKKRSRGLFLYA